MSKKTSRTKSAQPANQIVINLDDLPNPVQQAVDRATGWFGCDGRCFPLVGRWWDVKTGK